MVITITISIGIQYFNSHHGLPQLVRRWQQVVIDQPEPLLQARPELGRGELLFFVGQSLRLSLLGVSLSLITLSINVTFSFSRTTGKKLRPRLDPTVLQSLELGAHRVVLSFERPVQHRLGDVAEHFRWQRLRGGFVFAIAVVRSSSLVVVTVSPSLRVGEPRRVRQDRVRAPLVHEGRKKSVPERLAYTPRPLHASEGDQFAAVLGVRLRLSVPHSVPHHAVHVFAFELFI